MVNTMDMIMAFVEAINSPEFCLNSFIIFLELDHFTNSFMKTFISKKASCIPFVITDQ